VSSLGAMFFSFWRVRGTAIHGSTSFFHSR
jgi:hypothetical protein